MADTSSSIERGKAGRSVVTIVVPAPIAATAEADALKKIGARVNVKGFRPGKAPAEVVREKLDPEQFFEEIVRMALRVVMPTVLREHTLSPIIPPRIEAISRDPLTLKITFIERPPVKVKGIDTLAPPKEASKVAEKDIERVIQSALAEHRTFAVVDRPALRGDRVTASFSAVDQKGAPILGLRAEGERIVLGESGLLPGFEDALVGATAGSTRTFTLTLPEKFQVEELRKTQATFTATIQSVESVTAPVFDDAFATAHLQQPSAAAFRTMVETTIGEQEAQFQRMSRERALLDRIRENVQADLPEELVDQELRSLVEEWAARLQEQGKTVENALAEQGKTAKQMEEELRTEATNRWKLRLGIAHLIDAKTITLTPEQEALALEDFLDQLPDEERSEAEARIAKKDALYDEVRWRALVDTLITSLLA